MFSQRYENEAKPDHLGEKDNGGNLAISSQGLVPFPATPVELA